MKVLAKLALALSLAFVFGCGSEKGADGAAGASAAKAGVLNVVTTIGMVNDIVARVAGEHATCTNVIGEGVDPHLYKPTSSDVIKLSGADAVFYSGLMLEGKMGDMLVKVATKGKPVFAVTERIDEAFLLHPDGSEGHADPHVWMDVQGWMKAVEVIRDALIDIQPNNKADFTANASAYLEELASLDAYVKQVIGSIPKEQRVLVTAHDAFSYFGRAYELDVHGIQGLSTETETAIHDLNQLVGMLAERKIGAVFVESSVDPKNVKALIEGAASKGHKVSVGGELFSDAMGEAGTYEGTYVGMIDHNATIMARALGGEAPEKGLNGKLSLTGVAH